MEYVLTILIGLSALIQGGFYPTNFLIIGIVLSVCYIIQQNFNASSTEAVLWGIALWYGIVSLANGYDLDSLSQAGLIGVYALFLCLYNSLQPKEKRNMEGLLIQGTAVVAGVAIMAFCGVFHLTGAVISHRLQFTFQYANAAGSWLAAFSLLALDNEDKHARRLALPCVTALFLTQSVGALGLYGVIQVIRLYRMRREKIWRETILLHVMAAVFAGIFFKISGWICLPVLLVMYTAGGGLKRILPVACRFYVPQICLAISGAGAVALLFTQRFAVSMHTFVERIIQIYDGGKIILAHPLLGVGAGNWGKHYHLYQSAQYTSSVVHSSIVQAGVDSGILAIAAFIIFIVLAWKQKGRNLSENLAVVLLLTHSLVDFTLQFFPIGALLLMLLFAGSEPETKKNKTMYLWVTAIAGFSLLCGVLLYGQIQEKQLLHTAQDNAWKAVIAQYEAQSGIFGRSHTARETYIQALFALGDTEGVILAAKSSMDETMDEIILRAWALKLSGEQSAACSLLLDELEQRHCYVQLYEQTAQLLVEWQADASYIEAYNRLVDMANNGKTTLGILKGDQVDIDKIN